MYMGVCIYVYIVRMLVYISMSICVCAYVYVYALLCMYSMYYNYMYLCAYERRPLWPRSLGLGPSHYYKRDRCAGAPVVHRPVNCVSLTSQASIFDSSGFKVSILP